MLNIIKTLLDVLERNQIRKIWVLQILIIVMSILEVVGVLSIGQFMAIATDVNRIKTNKISSYLYELSGANNSIEFINIAGAISIVILGTGSLISMITSWRLMRTGETIGAEISARLFKYYMNQSWVYHSETNSSQLMKRLSFDCTRLTQNIIYPILQTNARLTLIALMGISIFLMSPIVTIISTLVFTISYTAIYAFVRKPLLKYSEDLSKLNFKKLKFITEGFSGIKDIIIHNKQDFFIKNYSEASTKSAIRQSNISIIGVVPRYAMEFIAFSLIIGLMMYLVGSKENSDAIPLISIIALAGMKLLPAFQNIYTAQSQIRGSITSFNSIVEDLNEIKKLEINHSGIDSSTHQEDEIKYSSSILFKNVIFYYPNKQKPALNSISLEFPANKTTALVGSSGSGKSTTIDLLLGLLRQNEGNIFVDDTLLTEKNLKDWRRNIGYVPQSIYLLDTSIAGNIAFAIPENEVNEERLKKAAELAHLDEFVNKLPDKYNTTIGERGVQLSGGQRQRIGIARALYNDPSIIIFDEATSALDGITEKTIMNAIQELSGLKTVIMVAHRLSTVRNCDKIHMLEAGQLIDSGNYEELINKNEKFQRMAGN